MTAESIATDDFEAHRARLIGLGYRMLGTRAEAEDLVQETYLRWHRTARAEIRSPASWLSTTMARLCIDELRQRKSRPEAYVGPWLPEPMPTAPPEDEAEHNLALADDLSVAFLLLLERLAPEERAAFLLHDVFDAGYADIAVSLGKSADAVRQIVSRARRRVADERPRFTATRREREHLAERFQRAVVSRDEGALLALLSPAAELISDGGGKALAALRPIYGAEKIMRFFMGVTKHTDPAQVTLRPCWINDAPSLVIIDGAGVVVATFSLEIADGRIDRLYAVRNPDKLARLADDQAGKGSGVVRP